MIPQIPPKNEENQLQFKLHCVGCVHRTVSSLLPKTSGFMVNGTNHIIRSSALLATAAGCRWCPKNILFVYFVL